MPLSFRARLVLTMGALILLVAGLWQASLRLRPRPAL